MNHIINSKIHCINIDVESYWFRKFKNNCCIYFKITNNISYYMYKYISKLLIKILKQHNNINKIILYDYDDYNIKNIFKNICKYSDYNSKSIIYSEKSIDKIIIINEDNIIISGEKLYDLLKYYTPSQNNILKLSYYNFDKLMKMKKSISKNIIITFKLTYSNGNIYFNLVSITPKNNSFDKIVLGNGNVKTSNILNKLS